MTITLELTQEQEARIDANARAMGIEPAEYLRRVIDDLPGHPEGPRPGETMFDSLRRIGVVGVGELTPRADGRPWSEVEGFE